MDRLKVGVPSLPRFWKGQRKNGSTNFFDGWKSTDKEPYDC